MSGQGDGMPVIEHKECPEHGGDIGIAFNDTCGNHPGPYTGQRRCGKTLVAVRYVPEAEVARLREALLAIARVPHSGDGDSSECARERGRLARLALR